MEVSFAEQESSIATNLVARILSGDTSAETELVERYRRGVSLILRRATARDAVSEDLLQDTFQLALEKIRRGELREPERLPGFICNIARNLAIDHFRQASRHLRMERDLKVDSASPPDQLQQVLAAEKASIVRKVLNELRPARDREILYRFYIAEQDKGEICAELDLTSLHFNRVLFRARERYRELYDKLSSKRTG